jgi:hypothetical protein
VFPAEPAVLVHFQSVGIVLLVLFGVVVSLLALGAGQHNLHSHFVGTSRFTEKFWGLFAPASLGKTGTKKEPLFRGVTSIAQLALPCQGRFPRQTGDFPAKKAFDKPKGALL